MRRQAQKADAEAHMDWHLASFSRLTGIDLSKFDLDETLPELVPTATAPWPPPMPGVPCRKSLAPGGKRPTWI